MFADSRDWLFGFTLSVSVLAHALLILAGVLGNTYDPPAQIAPRQGKASIQLMPSIEARREVAKHAAPAPTAPPAPRPREHVLATPAGPEVLPLPAVLPSTVAEVMPQPQEFEVIPEPTPIQAKPEKNPPAKKATTPQVAKADSRPSPASQASAGAIDFLPAEAVNPAPPYPPEARAASQEGTVTVRVKVDATGRVSAASIQESSGYALLDESALTTVQRWVFHPARRNGRAVACVIDKPFEFYIRRN